MLAMNLISRTLTLIAALALIAMVGHIGLDVGSRYLLGRSLMGTLEIVTYYYMAAVTVLPLAAVQVKREHVIVEVFTQGLRANFRGMLDLFSMLLGIGYLSVVAWACFQGAMNSFRRGEYHDLYFFTLSIWPPRWVLFLGMFGLFLVMVIQVATCRHAVPSSGGDDSC
ncbi:TRAP transporter small permease subunit [Halomonas mongoliensis]|uniref:TRAP transporter small permease subunit n=1 Tax=Halomonas mongoliensis TaxID=321265 RepID=UPI00403AFCF7